MKYLLIILTLFISIQANSQEQKTKRIKEKISIDGLSFKLKYYVLETNFSIKHGEYKKYDVINNLAESGYYKMGIKDSIWRTFICGKLVGSEGYYVNGTKEGLWNYYTNIPGGWKPTLIKSGNYTNDSMVGIWSYYNNGELEQVFNYSKDSLIYGSKSSEEKNYLIKTDSGLFKVKLDKPPMLIGGNNTRIENFKNMNIYQLDSLSEGNANISYTLSFWVKTSGETYNYEMINSINEEFSKYIIEYYKNNYKWIPGVLKGQNIECKVMINK